MDAVPLSAGYELHSLSLSPHTFAVPIDPIYCDTTGVHEEILDANLYGQIHGIVGWISNFLNFVYSGWNFR